jgi:hypothetical protein
VELSLVSVVDADNPVEGDLRLVGGDLVWTTDLSTEVAQRLRVRFRFFQGEWFLNRREGTPWFQQILTKNPAEETVRAVFTKVILGTEGIKTLEILTLTEDTSARTLSVDFLARLQDGTTFQSKDFPPFIMEF